METVIKLTPSELNQGLLDRIKNIIGSKKNIDVTISLTEVDSDYAEDLNNSIEQAEGKEPFISFTMEDFMAYNPAK